LPQGQKRKQNSRGGIYASRRKSADSRTRPEAAPSDFLRRDTRPRVSAGIPEGCPYGTNPHRCATQIGAQPSNSRIYLPPGGRGTAKRWMRNGVHLLTAQSRNRCSVQVIRVLGSRLGVGHCANFNCRIPHQSASADSFPPGEAKRDIPGGMPLRQEPTLPQPPIDARSMISGIYLPPGEANFFLPLGGKSDICAFAGAKAQGGINTSPTEEVYIMQNSSSWDRMGHSPGNCVRIAHVLFFPAAVY